MRARRDLHLAGSRRQHPHRNLQSPSRWVDDTDCAVSQFWSTDDAKTQAMKRVERVEDSDVRGVCAQGIVGAGGIIPTSTASCRWAAVAPDGARWIHARPALLPARFRSSGRLFRGKLVAGLRDAFRHGRLDFPASSNRWRPTRPSARFSDPSIARPGSSMRSRPLAARPTCCTTSRATPIGSPSPTTGSSTSTDDHRVVSVEGLRHGSQMRTLTLTVEEFLRRFLLHVLPKRFVRIRYFGFLASRHADPRARSVSPGPRGGPTTSGRPRVAHHLDAPRGRVLAAERPCASSND